MPHDYDTNVVCGQVSTSSFTLNKITDVWLKLKSLLLNVYYVTSGLTGRKGIVPKSASLAEKEWSIFAPTTQVKK